MIGWLEYSIVFFECIIAINLTFYTYEYLRLRYKFKTVYSKMEDVKPILNADKNIECASKHRDRLCGVVSSGDSKKYLGKEFSVNEIESLNHQDEEKLYQLYEAKLGKEIVTSLGNVILSLYSRAIGLTTPIGVLGYSVNLDSEERLTTDLGNDPIVKSGMVSCLSEIYYKYGVYLAPFTTMLITANHLDIKKKQLYIKWSNKKNKSQRSQRRQRRQQRRRRR